MTVARPATPGDTPRAAVTESATSAPAPAARIAVVGVPLSPEAAELVAAASVVVGGREQLATLAPPAARQVPLTGDLTEALDALAAAEGPACVLASGDPGFFGIVRRLAAHLGPDRLDVRPAPSSVAVAFARLGVPWDDALVVSAHGRAAHTALHTALRHPKVAILTAPDAPPEWFARRLIATDRSVAVAERLGTRDERVVTGTPDEIAAAAPFAAPNVLISLAPDTREGATARATLAPPRTSAAGWALPESAFEHRAGMITKAEVRAVALARLGPGVGDLVWDVGCGSGSVAVECARLGAAVVGLDHDADAVALTRRNAAAHGVPVDARHAAAPAALHDLPDDPDAVFVGGGGADLEAIVDACAARARRAVVVTLALIERAAPTMRALEAHGLTVEATMVQASRLRPLAGGHRLAAENPIVVVCGVRA